jgi:hypothetical protein
LSVLLFRLLRVLQGVDAGSAFTAPPSLSGVAVPAVGSSSHSAAAAGAARSMETAGDTAKTMHLIAAYQVEAS